MLELEHELQFEEHEIQELPESIYPLTQSVHILTEEHVRHGDTHCTA